jgi:hypothetical protein
MPKIHRSKTLPRPSKTAIVKSVRARQKQPNTQTPAEKAQWTRIRNSLAKKRRARRIEEKAEPGPVVQYSPSGDGLKRGPKIDPTRDPGDKCTEVLSGAFTPNEVAVLEKFRKSFPFPPTRSQFVRFLTVNMMYRGGFHAESDEKRRALLTMTK